MKDSSLYAKYMKAYDGIVTERDFDKFNIIDFRWQEPEI